MEAERKSKQTSTNVRLRAAREQRGWSQQTLANLLGTTKLTVGRWERGERSPQLFFRAKLTELFGMSVEELGLTASPEPKAPAEVELTQSSASPANPSPLPVLETVESRGPHGGGATLFTKKRLLAAVAALLLLILTVVGKVYASHPGAPLVHTTQSTPTPGLQKTISGGKLVINDSLANQNSNALYQWVTQGLCRFTGSAYRINTTGVNYCLLGGLTLRNFTYQIRLKIIQGTHEGIVLRANGNSKIYYLYLTINGEYGLDMIDFPNGKEPIEAGYSDAIIQGVNQFNELGVTADGASLALSINQRHITQLQDRTYMVGNIGICAGDYFDPTQASITVADYQHAQVWQFSPPGN